MYRDLLASCEEEKEAITRNPETSVTDEDKQLEKEIESKMEDLTSIPTFPGRLLEGILSTIANVSQELTSGVTGCCPLSSWLTCVASFPLR